MKCFKLLASSFTVMAILILASCAKENKFTIEGDVKGAKDKTMYLEHVGYSKALVIDSIKLTENGDFKFKHSRPAFPDFYRLRLNGHIINVSIDSTETITLHANNDHFASDYTIEGSEECSKIKELALLQIKTSREYNKLQKSYNTKEISEEDYQIKSAEILNEYKTTAKKYIFENPRSASAYFALFQQINNLLIFDPYDKDDNKTYSAVATSWNLYYPDTERSKHVYNLALQGIKVLRSKRPIEYEAENAKDYFDISLPDIHGKSINLYEYSHGKVVLLDFTAYKNQGSPGHNMLLGELYEKYKDKGFDIYQVSLDADEHFWKNAAVNIPWMCVRDPQSIYSEIAGMYNVKDIPSGFILNREGDIVKRLDYLSDDIDTEIKSHL